MEAASHPAVPSVVSKGTEDTKELATYLFVNTLLKETAISPIEWVQFFLQDVS